MKKIIIVLFVLLLLCGCNTKETIEVKEEIEEVQEVVEEQPKEEYDYLYFEDAHTIWGADPGLGIDVLHNLGYKGKGSIIAYCDTKIQLDHEQFKDADIIYEDFPAGERKEWHGYGVLSLLLGKDIGTAPETKLYYFGYEPTNDQQKIADVIDEVIRVNNTLPENEKISMLGFSNNIKRVGPDRINQQAGIDAAQRCRDAGIMIFFCGENGSLYFKDGTNRNDPESCYNIPMWKNEQFELCKVPAASRTTAGPGGIYSYDDENNPGMSWTMPYSIGVYAIAVSIDPTLTENDIRSLIVQTAFINSRGMRIINPCEFIAVVLERVGRNEDADELRQAYKDSITNYDENKYEKMCLDPSLKPFRGTIIEKKLKPNSEILNNLSSPCSLFYVDDSLINDNYEISDCNISSTSDGKLTITYNINLPKRMKATIHDLNNEKEFNTKIAKTKGKLQNCTIELSQEEYKDVDTLLIDYVNKNNEFKLYIDLFSYFNPEFEEIKEEIRFENIDYNYSASEENELSYRYDRRDLTDSLVNINKITYEKNNDNFYTIKINAIANNDMQVCLFDPPNGDIVKQFASCEKLINNDILFNVTNEKLSKVDNLMLNFYVSDNDRVFIELDLTPLK